MESTEKPDSNISSAAVVDAFGETELSLIDLLHVLTRYRLLAMGVAAVVFFGSVTYAFTATPIYRAEMMLAPMRGAPGGMGSIISSFGGALGSLAGMVGMGASGSAGSRLIRGEALVTLLSTSYIQSFIEEENLLPILFEDLWDPEKEEWVVDDETQIPTLSDGYDLFFNEIVRAEEDSLTGIVTMSVEWKDPVLAAEWGNKLVGNLNARLRRKALTDADKTIDFLNQELERTKVVELRQAVFYMIEQQISSKTSARVQKDFAFKIINPAVAPDIDKYIKPERPFIIGMGLVFGIFAGIITAFMAFALSHIRSEYKKRTA